MADSTHASGVETEDGEVHVHVHSWKFYLGILLALIFLTVVTVAVSYVDVDAIIALGEPVEGIGAWNLALAILIAGMKASLVVLFFMHLKEDARFNGLIFVGSLIFVGVFFAYTLNDTASRGQMDVFNGVHVDPATGERAPGGIPAPMPGQELEEGMQGPAADSSDDAAGDDDEGEASHEP